MYGSIEGHFAVIKAQHGQFYCSARVSLHYQFIIALGRGTVKTITNTGIKRLSNIKTEELCLNYFSQMFNIMTVYVHCTKAASQKKSYKLTLLEYIVYFLVVLSPHMQQQQQYKNHVENAVEKRGKV